MTARDEHGAEKDAPSWGEMSAKYDDMLRWLAVQEQADELQRVNPDWRRGQALFNALHLIDPGLANQIRGTEADPFHSAARERVQAFASVVMARDIPPGATS